MRSLQLQASHELQGAIFRPEAGWSVPVGYGPVDAEVRAVRTRAGMIDLSDRAKIELTGTERLPFLDGVVTADLKILRPGASTYALVLNEKSRVLGDLRVFVFEDRLVIDLDASQKDGVLGILERARISDDVEFRDLGGVGHIEIHGPAASEVLAGVAGAAVQRLPRDGFSPIPMNGELKAHVAHVPALGVEGYAIWSEASILSELWGQLAAAAGVRPFGRDAWEVLRIEAGTPRFGSDMGPDTLALESGPASAISFTKGCYVGQEVVARGTYIGQVRRKFAGLRVDGDLPPAHRDRVLKGGKEVGFVTSAAWSPTVGFVIALALLRIDEISPRDVLSVDRGGRDLQARLNALPFVPASS